LAFVMHSAGRRYQYGDWRRKVRPRHRYRHTRSGPDWGCAASAGSHREDRRRDSADPRRGGKLLIGPNDIVLEFGPFSGERDVRGVTLVAMRVGTASVPVNVDLSPEAAGRFHGTMILPWTDNCRLEVRWQDDHGHHRHAFTVPVIVGHH